MSEKKIIQFDTASQVNSDAYVPITQQVNGDQKTLKALIDQLGDYISRVQQYNDLDTTAKDLIGAINEAAQSGSIEMEQTVTTPVSIASINDGGDNIPVKSLKVLVSAVQSGSGTPSPSNIRSISGWSGANIVSTGKNIFASELIIIGTFTNGTWSLTGNSETDLKKVYNGKFKPNTQYTFSGHEVQSAVGKSVRIRVIYTDGTNANIFLDSTTSGTDFTFTSASGKSIDYIDLGHSNMGSVDITNFQIEEGSSATTYEVPKGTTHTIPFGQTVYGGLLDVTKGVLTVTHGYVDMGTLSWAYNSQYAVFTSGNITNMKFITDVNNIMCSAYAISPVQSSGSPDLSVYTRSVGGITGLGLKNSNYTDGSTLQTSLDGIICVYELATPTTIYLTPTQVKTLLTCNIFADTGDIDTLIYFNSNADETADVVEAYVGNVVNLYATLATGNTSVTISSSTIHTNSTIDIYTDNDVDYISAVVTEGQIVVNFDAQASNLGVKVRVS